MKVILYRDSFVFRYGSRKINGTIRITTSPLLSQDFVRWTFLQLKQQIRQRIELALPRLKSSLDVAIDQEIRTSPEYHSLTRGHLYRELGLGKLRADGIDIEATIDDIIEKIQLNLLLEYQDRELGALVLGVLRSDLHDVLSLPGAAYISQNTRYGTSTNVPWLYWLLVESDNVVVTQWEVKANKTVFVGTRTEEAVMVQPKRRASVGYAITEYRGTQENNWLTRSVDKLTPLVTELLGNV